MALGAALLLAGCAAVPRLGPRPEPLAPAQVAAAQSLPATPGAQWPTEGWWRAYGDPQLDALIAEGLAKAPDVAAAQARLDRAAALARQAGAPLLPKVDVQGQAGEQRNSTNIGLPSTFANLFPHGWQDVGQLSVNLGFDLDLWGKNRAALAAATSERRAAALDAEQARLVLAVAVTSAYVDLARLEAEREVRAGQLETATRARQLLGQRQANGLETRGGVAVSEADLAEARIALSSAEEAVVLRRNQLAALVGAGPDRGLAITRPRLAIPAARGVPDDVTTDLVGRRPDVVAARERVEAAASRIKVARADFFPALRLSAMYGLQTVGLDLLFDRNSQTGFAGPAFSLPIFHGGELAGRYRGARADYDGAVAAYNGAVLAGYREAADALTTARLVGQRLADARIAREAAELGFREINLRYQGGLVTYLDVLQVQDRLLRAQLAVALLEQAARNADVGLVRALGGGYAPAGAAAASSGMTASMKDEVHG
ncbi:efflux transporter outer membrane subunit [Novosphingobium bradum]|uniref:Efflux transporter outer membrane subunit n=1 Tax=Novosphingobium bradum TaxID=1737444 RepID=A0ABV7IMB7_9SPHN